MGECAEDGKGRIEIVRVRERGFSEGGKKTAQNRDREVPEAKAVDRLRKGVLFTVPSADELSKRRKMEKDIGPGHW